MSNSVFLVQVQRLPKSAKFHHCQAFPPCSVYYSKRNIYEVYDDGIFRVDGSDLPF